jgi:hypothetical protein
MDTTDSHCGELDFVRLEGRGMYPTSKPLPDFYREETAVIGHPQDHLLTSNSVLLLIYGLTMGLVIGFSLGVSAHTALVSGM